MTGSICKINGCPTAVHTKSGWILPELTTVRKSVNCLINLATTHVLKENIQPHGKSKGLDEQLRLFWELESLGVQEQKIFYNEFAACIAFHDSTFAKV